MFGIRNRTRVWMGVACFCVGIVPQVAVADISEFCVKTGALCLEVRPGSSSEGIEASVLKSFVADASDFSAPIVASDGNLYGTAGSGDVAGIIYRVTSAGVFSVLHQFTVTDGISPRAALVQGPDGSLYGTTNFGGQDGGGTIFRITLDGVFSTIHNFRQPGLVSPAGPLMLASDGNFYGITNGGDSSSPQGGIFKATITGNSATVSTLYSFATVLRAYENVGLLEGVDGKLYGTFHGGTDIDAGAVYRVSKSGDFEYVHVFSNVDGAIPAGTLIRDSQGNIYGTTVFSGSEGGGVVFKVSPSGTYSVLHNFEYSNGSNAIGALLLASDGNLYGTTGRGGAAKGGTVFRIGVNGDGFQTIANLDQSSGIAPIGGLAQGGDGQIYGLATGSGPEAGGTIFRFTPSTAVSVFYAFIGSDASDPRTGLIVGPDGNLYGTTSKGGEFGEGVVFRLTRSGAFSVLHSFNIEEGENPSALIVGRDGNLYGTLATGGPELNACGSIYRLTLDGTFSLFHVFGEDDEFKACLPLDLIQSPSGTFYGVTALADIPESGTLFRITEGGEFTRLRLFEKQTGYEPQRGLLRTESGDIYGSLLRGGSGGTGALFRYSAAGDFSIVKTFTAQDGLSFENSLVQLENGEIYGTRGNGGVDGAGFLFRINADNSYSTVREFRYDAASGGKPIGALARYKDGFIGSTGFGGPTNGGSVFFVDAAGSFSVLHNFGTQDGVTPIGTLAVDPEELSIFGTTEILGSQKGGTVFKLMPVTVETPPTPVDNSGGGGALSLANLLILLIIAAGLSARVGTLRSRRKECAAGFLP